MWAALISMGHKRGFRKASKTWCIIRPERHFFPQGVEDGQSNPVASHDGHRFPLYLYHLWSKWFC